MANACNPGEAHDERTLVAERKLMQEVTADAGLTRVPVTDNWLQQKGKIRRQFRSQFAVEDFDRDGYLDFAVASVQGPTGLFKSVDGKRFNIANLSHRVKTVATRTNRSLATWIDFYPMMAIQI